MRYAKLIDGKAAYAPNPILHAGLWYGNPPGEIYEAEGYKPVVYSDPPGEAPSGFQWSEIWSEDDFNIQQSWELVEVPITEEEAITRYANEITGADDPDIISVAETMINKLSKED